jgi:dTDP-4-dehydrorhamnose reductase
MSGKKILITGSNGMLGSTMLKSFPYKSVGYSSDELDITNSKDCMKILISEKPDVIIHTAAYTNVEECEVNFDKTYKVNVLGTQNLVNYCIDKDILFIYISSTGIYGRKRNDSQYNEFDDVEPTTIHHKSKYEAEKIVENHLNKFLILEQDGCSVQIKPIIKTSYIKDI